MRMVGAGQERRRRQQVPSPPAVPGLCPPGAPEPARARGRGMDTPLGPRWLPARGDRAARGWAALFRGAGAHTYVPGGRVARASVGDFLALQQAHHPLEVPGVNDSSVVTGLPGILPVELLWGDGSGRGPPHPRIRATTGEKVSSPPWNTRGRGRGTVTAPAGPQVLLGASLYQRRTRPAVWTVPAQQIGDGREMPGWQRLSLGGRVLGGARITFMLGVGRRPSLFSSPPHPPSHCPAAPPPAQGQHSLSGTF